MYICFDVITNYIIDDVNYITSQGITILLQDNDRLITALRSMMKPEDRLWLRELFGNIVITNIIDNTLGMYIHS